MITLNISPSPVPVQIATLATFDQKVSKAASRALDEAAAAILNRLRLTYRQESSPSGAKWPPSRAGVVRKARGGSGTMFDTGRLFRSIQLYKTAEHERLIGTDVPYAVYHQGPQAQVERTFLEITQAHLDLSEKIFSNRLLEAMS